MFLKELEGKKVRYYKKYKIDGTKDYKQFSCTLLGKTRAVQAEAERILDQMHADWLGSKELELDVTVQRAVEEYLIFREKAVKRSTFLMQKPIIMKLSQEWANVLLVNLTTDKIQKYFNKQEWKKDYRRLVKTIFACFFRFCVDMAYIKENPIDNLKLPKIRVTLEERMRKKLRFLDRQEMTSFIDYLSENGDVLIYNLAVEFMYLTGLRFNELAGLMWSAIDFECGVLKIEKGLYNVGSEKILGSPKTLASYRLVSFNNRCLEILRMIKEMNLSDIFIFFFNSKHINLQLFNYYIKRHFKAAGIKDISMSSHVLRHSHISLLAELRVPEKAIMERVGHTDYKTTIEIYTHVTENMQTEIVNLLNTI